MSRNSKLLVADGLKIRCAAKQHYAVAVPVDGKLKVTKRTDDLGVVLAELRNLVRFFPRRPAHVFHLPTATLVYSRSHGWPLPDLRLLAGHVREATKNTIPEGADR
jgi:hypothetical protein